jgi:hypothetical protein
LPVHRAGLKLRARRTLRCAGSASSRANSDAADAEARGTVVDPVSHAVASLGRLPVALPRARYTRSCAHAVGADVGTGSVALVLPVAAHADLHGVPGASPGDGGAHARPIAGDVAPWKIGRRSVGGAIARRIRAPTAVRASTATRAARASVIASRSAGSTGARETTRGCVRAAGRGTALPAISAGTRHTSRTCGGVDERSLDTSARRETGREKDTNYKPSERARTHG